MKKQFLLSLLCLGVVSCSTNFSVKLVEDMPNIEDPVVDPENVGIYQGDEIDPTGKTKKTLLLANDSDEEKEFTTSAEVFDYIEGDGDFIGKCDMNQWKYLTLGIGGFKLGSLSIWADGILTFNFLSSITDVVIYAHPRYAYEYGEGKEPSFVIDDEVYIRANNNKYIQLDSDFEKKEDVEDTVCSFTLTSQLSNLAIRVNGGRSVITKIELFTK